MPEEFKPGCQRPTILRKNVSEAEKTTAIREENKEMVRVAKPAPDFTAPGFYQGKFLNFNLSEYKGKWVLLCFYPGDFTFV